MTRITKILGIVLFAAIILIVISPVSATNLVSNPGFETGSLSTWTSATGSLSSIGATTAIKQSGSYSCRYYMTDLTGYKSGYISQPISFDSAGNTLTYYYYDHAGGGTGYTYVTVYVDGTAVDSYVGDPGDPNWGSWVYRSVDLSGYGFTGTKTLKFEVGFGSHHYGEVYIDTIDLQHTNPTAAFSATPLRGKVPLTVTFTNTDTKTTAYDWDFGDGSAHSTSANPTHEYTVAGNSYTVTHTATNLVGSDVETKVGYITTNKTTTAAFSGTPTSGTAPLTVTFTDASVGDGINGWSWNFGDGSATNATNQHPVHTFTTSGVYTVNLTVSSPDGSSTLTKPNYVEVTAVVPHVGIAVGGRIYNSVTFEGLSYVAMTLTNTTTGSSQVLNTNTTGYFVFNNMSPSTAYTYVLSGVKSGYLDTSTTFSLTAEDVAKGYLDKSFGMEVIGSSADQGVGGRYAPNLVRFTVKHYWTGEPIEGVNVTAQGVGTTAGSGAFEDSIDMLSTLFGFDFVTSPIQSTLMAGETGSDGAITFWMVENVKYHITFEKDGVEIASPLTIYPKEYEYLVPVTGTASPDQGATTNSTFTSDKVNTTYSYINVSYTDTAFKTTTTKLVISKIVNSSTETEVYTKTEFGYTSSTFDASYIFESEAGDQYYVTLTTGHPDFGEKSETKLITIPGRQLDLRLENTDYYSWIALALIYLVAQMGGSKRTRDVSIAMTLFAGFMWISGWLPISTLLMQAALMFAILYYTRTAEDQ